MRNYSAFERKSCEFSSGCWLTFVGHQPAGDAVRSPPTPQLQPQSPMALIPIMADDRGITVIKIIKMYSPVRAYCDVVSATALLDAQWNGFCGWGCGAP